MEHIIFNFREWRLKYFLDNNHIPTEAVLCILISVLLLAVFFQLISRKRATAHILLFFLMATQVVNAVFHIFFSLYYSDFSPGTITAIFLYLPINFLIIQSAFREGLLKNSNEQVKRYAGTWTKAYDEVQQRAKQVNEEILKEFTDAQIATLKKEYEPFRGKSISVSAANKLKNVFERIPDAVLKKLKDADIPFLSSMALTKMILKGMPTRE